MASVEIFTEEEDEILITLVSQHPLLYDLSVEDYRNTRKKDKTWSEIGVKLNKRGDSCKKHWKNLKDTYLRQKRKSGTGSAAPKNPRSKFNAYVKLFSFLESVPNERSTISNVDPHDIITQESQSSQTSTQDRSPLLAETNLTDDSSSSLTNVSRTSSPASTSSLPSFPKSNKTRTKKDDILTYLQKREVSRQKVLENLRNRDEDDDLLSFSEHIKVVLRKLKPLRRLQAKRAIFDVLMTYETLDVESADIESNRPSPSSSYVSSNISIDSNTPESQDTPDNAIRPQYALELVSNNNNLPIYSVYYPISQVSCNEEEPTNLSLVSCNEEEPTNVSLVSCNEEEPTNLPLVQFSKESFFEE